MMRSGVRPNDEEFRPWANWAFPKMKLWAWSGRFGCPQTFGRCVLFSDNWPAVRDTRVYQTLMRADLCYQDTLKLFEDGLTAEHFSAMLQKCGLQVALPSIVLHSESTSAHTMSMSMLCHPQ